MQPTPNIDSSSSGIYSTLVDKESQMQNYFVILHPLVFLFCFNF